MGPHPRPYDGMNHQQLVSLAKRTLEAAAELPPHSIERAIKFAAYDSVVNEAKRRMAIELNEKLDLPEIDL